MKIALDTDKNLVTINRDGKTSEVPIASQEAFDAISDAWLRCGWDVKYVYTWTWLGRPIIQLPEDMFRTQEAIFKIKPDFIIETGVAHGGSLIFYAGLCKILGKGHVVGVDIEIRPHNRKAIEEHFLSEYITLIEGGSTASAVVQQVREIVKPGKTVLVLLDSCHSKEHVLNELKAYADFVSTGSYIVATDGIMKDLNGAPRSNPDWKTNNPFEAAKEFARANRKFRLKRPEFVFNESAQLKEDPVTYWPGAWLERI